MQNNAIYTNNKRIGLIKIIGLAIIIASVLFYFFINLNTKEPIVSQLNPPLIRKSGGDVVSNVVIISGSGYPKALVSFYINNNYIDEVSVDENGTFTKNISITTEGASQLKAQQTYKNVTSDWSENVSFLADITPPDADVFTIATELPNKTKSTSLEIQGKAPIDSYVYINTSRVEVSKDSTYSTNYELQEGLNDLKFLLEDKIGNRTQVLQTKSILVDNTPPKLSTNFCFKQQDVQDEACVDIGQWQGFLPNVSVPITGHVKGDIATITVDGKNVSWDENGEIYSRLQLYIYNGLNKYKVVVTDSMGNSATGYVSTTAEDVKDTQDINLNLNE